MTQRAILTEDGYLFLEVGATRGEIPLDEGFAEEARKAAVFTDGDQGGTLGDIEADGVGYQLIEDVDQLPADFTHEVAGFHQRVSETRAMLRELEVSEYFRQVLGGATLGTDSHGFPLDSGCGEDCRRAIDASHAFLIYVRNAFGVNSKAGDMVIDACRRTVLCYMHG